MASLRKDEPVTQSAKKNTFNQGFLMTNYNNSF